LKEANEAVILCAGKSTRTYPLTLRKPKPMLKVAGKRVIEYLLSQLRGLVSRAVIVIGFEGRQIVEALGKRFFDVELTYVEQAEQKGTGDALLCAEKHVGERFILLNGDDLLKRHAIRALKGHEICVLAAPHEQPWRFGVLSVDGEFVNAIIEKPKDAPPKSLVSTGAYALTRIVFELLREIEASETQELMFTQVVPKLSSLGLRYEVTEDGWMPITYPWDILRCAKWLMDELREQCISGWLGKGVKVFGAVESGCDCIIGDGVIIVGPSVLGSYVTVGERSKLMRCAVGDNVSIGQNCELEECVIGDGVRIGNNVRMKRSVVGDRAVIGDGVLTHTRQCRSGNVLSFVRGEWIDTGFDELGAFIGDDAVIEDGCKLMAGVKVWANVVIPSNSVVDADAIE